MTRLQIRLKMSTHRLFLFDTQIFHIIIRELNTFGAGIMTKNSQFIKILPMCQHCATYSTRYRIHTPAF